MQHTPVVWIEGKLFDPAQAQVSVFDRSYLYGDSLYEVIRTYGGRFDALTEHLQRLRRTAQLCHLELAQSDSELQAACQTALDQFHRQNAAARPEAYCRLIVSRGRGRIGFSRTALETPSLVTVIVQAVEEPSAEKHARGAHLRIVERRRLSRAALEPAAKTGNYLNCLLAFLEAEEQGADDALLLDEEGHLTEGTTFNLFYVKRGILVTPPLEVGILEGITRARVIRLARSLGIPVREVRFPPQRLFDADEAFLTGTVKEILAVSEIDGREIGRRGRRPITERLRAEFRKLTRGTLS